MKSLEKFEEKYLYRVKDHLLSFHSKAIYYLDFEDNIVFSPYYDRRKNIKIPREKFKQVSPKVYHTLRLDNSDDIRNSYTMIFNCRESKLNSILDEYSKYFIANYKNENRYKDVDDIIDKVNKYIKENK